MDHRQQFEQLSRLLIDHKAYWQFVPFAEMALPWQGELAQWLAALSDEQVTVLRQDAQATQIELAKILPVVEELEALSKLTPSAASPMTYPSRLDWQIPGRKWQQITQFNEALTERQTPWLEWCAGKGHLGRALAATSNQGVTSLEWQGKLCQHGQELATRFDLEMTFVEGDAFAPDAANHLCRHQHAVALHACGDLHVTLMRHGVRAQTEHLSISPCCYHLIQAECYQPISSLGQQYDLNLSKLDLKLPLQETVTAPNHVQVMRQLELSFRLGFDVWQRSQQLSDDYMPVPNVPKSLLKQGFEAFCQWALEKKGLSAPLTGLDEALRQGKQRVQLVERMELVRQPFRRPLELWLVLDRACYLEEQGYDVRLSTFCDRDITPRNILIQASRR
ncbi:methyltransferase [Ferrimonas aestuarii]|uniref:Methyltransferase n=1 Tax=Ferrimonas aestuarii TaxID=2569539 RepID=A0A4U1BR14_9GAMM|nr:methyltransferase [Ferrimonas aestuarii]TKB55354.1 methyltransferase [Ferrimonas aestuarii]